MKFLGALLTDNGDADKEEEREEATSETESPSLEELVLQKLGGEENVLLRVDESNLGRNLDNSTNIGEQLFIGLDESDNPCLVEEESKALTLAAMKERFTIKTDNDGETYYFKDANGQVAVFDTKTKEAKPINSTGTLSDLSNNWRAYFVLEEKQEDTTQPQIPRQTSQDVVQSWIARCDVDTLAFLAIHNLDKGPVVLRTIKRDQQTGAFFFVGMSKEGRLFLTQTPEDACHLSLFPKHTIIQPLGDNPLLPKQPPFVGVKRGEKASLLTQIDGVGVFVLVHAPKPVENPKK